MLDTKVKQEEVYTGIGKVGLVTLEILVVILHSYVTHIPYYFKTLYIINFDYKINTNITIGTGTKQGKVHIDKLVITLSLGL